VPDPPPVPEALVPYGWDDRVAALWAGVPADAVPGRVISAARGRLFVRTADGTVLATANAAGWADDDEPVVPTTGDWVGLSPDPAGGGDGLRTVLGVLPRWSQIARVDALGRAEQVLAADVDVVLVVLGLDRPVKAGRVDRSLVLAWDSGAVPVLVLTKADLVDAASLRDVLDEVARLAPGVAVRTVAADDPHGVEAVRDDLRDHRTAVLLGESGGGKSTLVNRLVGSDVRDTGRVRAGDAKGRHTTASRDLVPIPGGGILIDTPGLRGLGVWDARDGMSVVYDDIEALASACRFGDCSHRTEPGCAVRAAVDDGSLDADRLHRYLALTDEIAANEARRDDTARREKKRRDKVAMRARRAYRKGPDR
jgi:ribosome biogenesis GTPase / thiamine phosphate phosphatase